MYFSLTFSTGVPALKVICSALAVLRSVWSSFAPQPLSGNGRGGEQTKEKWKKGAIFSVREH